LREIIIEICAGLIVLFLTVVAPILDRDNPLMLYTFTPPGAYPSLESLALSHSTSLETCRFYESEFVFSCLMGEVRDAPICTVVYPDSVMATIRHPDTGDFAVKSCAVRQGSHGKEVELRIPTLTQGQTGAITLLRQGQGIDVPRLLFDPPRAGGYFFSANNGFPVLGVIRRSWRTIVATFIAIIFVIIVVMRWVKKWQNRLILNR
jgi:hypothetical protein